MKVCKVLFAIYGHYDINWSQVILDEFYPKQLSNHENTLFHGIYLTRIFSYFGVDTKGEEFISRKLFDKSNIALLKISPFFMPYETLVQKDARLAREEEEEIHVKEEGKGMDIEEEEESEEETSLESITFHLTLLPKIFSTIKGSLLRIKIC